MQRRATFAAKPMVNGKRVDDLATLSRDPWIASLGPRDFGAFVDLLEEIEVPRGVKLAAQGDENDAAYFVLEGCLRITRKSSDAARIEPGHHCALAAVLDTRPSPFSIDATSDSRVACLPRSRFDALGTSHPALAARISRAIAVDLSQELESRGDAPMAGTVKVSDRLPKDTMGRIVGAFLDNRAVSLATQIDSDSTVVPIALGTAEGRDIFLRSVGLLVLEVMSRVVPKLRVSWGPVIGSTHVVQVIDAGQLDLTKLAEDVAVEMRAHVGAATPFHEEVWSNERARRHFEGQGWGDAAALLSLQLEPRVSVVRCENLAALSMGPVLPNAEMLGHVRVLPHAQGLLIDLAEHLAERATGRSHDTQIDPVLQESTAPRFASEMAAAHRTWLSALGIESVGAYDEACIAGRVSELVRVSEGFHEKRIAQIADAVASRRDSLKVIRIAGPSSSGKTTFIKRLMVQLEINGIRPVNISLDDYYVDREKTPRDEHGEYDYESLDAIDRTLLKDQLTRLLSGESGRLARYDFLTGKSIHAGGEELTLSKGDVLVLEGLHALDESLLEDAFGAKASFGIFIHPATTIPLDPLNGVSTEDVRLLRRIVRDRHQRGCSAADNIARFASVRRGEQLRVFPSEPFADVVFDSSLVYELSVMKVFAERYLLEVPRVHSSYPTALRLRALLDRFVAIDPEHVPPTSILREFIGGSGFEY